MNLQELMKKNREEEFKAVCKFIFLADTFELAKIIEEIRCCHDNLFAFNVDTKLLAKIDSVYLNGESILINIGKME